MRRRFAALVATELRAQRIADVVARATCSRFDLMLYDVAALRAARRATARSSPRRGSTTWPRVTRRCRRCSRPRDASSAAPRARSCSTTTRRSAARARRAPAATFLLETLERIVAGLQGRRSRRASRARAPARAGLGRHGPRGAPELRRQARARPPARARPRPGDQVEREPVLRDRRASRPARSRRCARGLGVAPQHFTLAQRPAVRLDDRADHRGAHRHSHRRRRQPDALHALVPRDGGQPPTSNP